MKKNGTRKTSLDNRGSTVFGWLRWYYMLYMFWHLRFSVFSLRTRVRPSWISKVENAIHWIKLYPNDCRIGFPNTCPLDSDLSSENCYPMFEKLEPVGYVSKYWHWCFPLRVLGAWSPIYIYIFLIGQLRNSISGNLNVTHHSKDLRFLPLSRY